MGAKVTVDARLSVSTQTETVEVVGAGGAVVNTQSQELSQIVNTQQISALPSLTRNAYDFVALSGNVSSGRQNRQRWQPRTTPARVQARAPRPAAWDIPSTGNEKAAPRFC